MIISIFSQTTWYIIAGVAVVIGCITLGTIIWRYLKKSSSPPVANPTPAGNPVPAAPACPPTTNKTKDNLGCTIVLVTMVLGLAWVAVTGIQSIDQAVSRNASAPAPVVAKEAKQDDTFTIPAGETVKVSLQPGFKHWEIEAQAPDKDAYWEIYYQQVSFFKGTSNLCFRGGGPGDQRGPALTSRFLELKNLEEKTVKIRVSSW